MQNQTTKTKRAPQQWVMVTYRFADKKARVRAAKDSKCDPDKFGMTVAYPVDHCGFLGAFEKAKEFIRDNKLMHGNTFEYRIDGGEW